MASNEMHRLECGCKALVSVDAAGNKHVAGYLRKCSGVKDLYKVLGSSDFLNMAEGVLGALQNHVLHPELDEGWAWV
jgi:hypothetical protein